jgi:hypothetical protein
MTTIRHTIIAIAAILVLLISTPPASAQGICRVEIPASGQDYLGAKGVWTRLGQLLTIPNRRVTAIGYHVRRVGNPTGDVLLSIRDSETDAVIFAAIWGDASELETGGTQGYITVQLKPPLRIDGDVRISAEYYGGNETDYVQGGYFSGERIEGESYTNYLAYGVWHDIGGAEEGAYMYEYECENGVPPTNGTPPPNGTTPDGNPGSRLPVLLAVMGGIWIAIGGAVYLARRKGGAE